MLLVLAYFGIVTTSYGFSLWMPTVVKSLTGLPNFTGLAAGHPPLRRRRDLHDGERAFVRSQRGAPLSHHRPDAGGGAGLFLGVASRAPALGLLSLALVGAGIYGFMPSFWAMPRWFLSGAAGAAAVGLINSVGCLGGFAGPYLMGKMKTGPAGYGPGLAALGVTATFAAVMVFLVRRRAGLQYESQIQRRPPGRG